MEEYAMLNTGDEVLEAVGGAHALVQEAVRTDGPKLPSWFDNLILKRLENAKKEASPAAISAASSSAMQSYLEWVGS